MVEPKTTFAWCFSHGRLHHFRPSAQDPDGAWCTARWIRLDGATEEEAMRTKTEWFGSAQFLHHLPLAAQHAVMFQVGPWPLRKVNEDKRAGEVGD